MTVTSATGAAWSPPGIQIKRMSGGPDAPDDPTSLRNMTHDRGAYVEPPDGWWIRIHLNMETGELSARRNSTYGYRSPVRSNTGGVKWSERPNVLCWESSQDLTDIWVNLVLDAVAFYARRMLAALEPVSGSPGWDWTPDAAAYYQQIRSVVGGPQNGLKPRDQHIDACYRRDYGAMTEQIKEAIPDWATREVPVRSDEVEQVLVRGLAPDARGGSDRAASWIAKIMHHDRPDNAPEAVPIYQWTGLVTLEHAIERLPDLVDPEWAMMSDAELDRVAQDLASQWFTIEQEQKLRAGTDWSGGSRMEFVGLHAGLRRWRAAAIEAMTGHPAVEASGWYGKDRAMPEELTADLSDLELSALADRVRVRASHEHQITLVGLVDLFTTVRAGLRQQVRTELERVGAQTKEKERELKGLRATRGGLVLRVVGWGDPDDCDAGTGAVNQAKLAGLAGMSRQAIDQMLAKAGDDTRAEKLDGLVYLVLRSGRWMLRHANETLEEWPASDQPDRDWCSSTYAQRRAAELLEKRFGQIVISWSEGDEKYVMRGVLA